MSQVRIAVKTAVLAGGLALMVGVTSTLSADSSVDPKPSGEAVEAAGALAMSDELAAYGHRRDDPLALIMAAKIKKEHSLAEREGTPTTQGVGGSAEQPPTGGNSPDELLARARELAGEQRDLLDLIGDVEAIAARGDIRGAGCYADTVNGGWTDTWPITYTPGVNWVSLSGDGDTDLDLYVFSGDGRLICESVGYTDREYCRWNQRQTGTIHVSVQNLGRVWNHYRLCTN